MPSFLTTAVGKAVLRSFEDLATPTSLKAAMLFNAGEWDQLAEMRVEPRHYRDSESYWRDACATSLLRKLVELPTSFDRKAVAEAGFLESEKKCLRTNLRLLPYLSPGLPDTNVGVTAFLRRARKIARRILGDSPPDLEGRFGPGATYGDRGNMTTLPHKMSSEPTITSSVSLFQHPWWSTLWARACKSEGREPVIVRGNRFTTVPKDCTKDRGIAVEPSINVFYQLGAGRAIRHALRRFGIDLTNGQDTHKRVACEASIRGHLATLDLSNASDTVCINLVKLILPTMWYETLDDLRSKRTEFRDKWHLLEKFSSMGNGFTFELETLIFLCLALACDPTGQKLVPGDNVFVYGDDIIVPTECSQAVVAALEFFGFSLNKTKSFVSGPFRESCGGDFFDGVDVRPYFLKESPCEPQQLIAFANGIRRLTTSGPLARRSLLRRSWFIVLDDIPTRIRDCRGPEGLGDLVIHDEESRWRTRQRGSTRYFGVYRPARHRTVAWQRFAPEVTLASAVYGVPWNNGKIIPRDSVSGYKVGWVADPEYSKWLPPQEYGPRR